MKVGVIPCADGAATLKTGFVSAEGLTCDPGGLHFNTPSLLAFGRRCYEVFKALEKPIIIVSIPTPEAHSSSRRFDKKEAKPGKIRPVWPLFTVLPTSAPSCADPKAAAQKQ